jgi:hypothetical protein
VTSSSPPGGAKEVLFEKFRLNNRQFGILIPRSLARHRERWISHVIGLSPFAFRSPSILLQLAVPLFFGGPVRSANEYPMI